MTNEQRRTILAIGLCAAVFLGALLLGTPPGSLVVLTLSAAVGTFRARRRRGKESELWQIVWTLRHAGTDERARMLESLEPAKLRRHVEKIIAADGTQEAFGDREQFPFPRGLARNAGRAYWLWWAISIGVLISAVVSTAPVWLRVPAVVTAAICAYGAWLASRRESELRSVIEVTPFRISELLADGTMRTLSWNNYLELHNEPRHTRLRVTPGPHEEGIAIDYRRMGFDRLLALIKEYGGFQPSQDS